MIDFTKPIIGRKDGTFVVTYGTYPYHVLPSDSKYAEVKAYLAEHPEALVPEPVQPEPTSEQKAAIRKLEIKARLSEIDLKTARAGRCIAIGREVEANSVYLIAYEDEADTLRTELRSLL